MGTRARVNTIGLWRHWQGHMEKYGPEACRGPYEEYGCEACRAPIWPYGPTQWCHNPFIARCHRNVLPTIRPHSGCAIYASPYDNIWTRKIRQYMDLKCNKKNYRPVTITSVHCRVLGNIIGKDVLRHLEKKTTTIISNHQHGFTKRKSCETNFLESYDFITEIDW